MNNLTRHAKRVVEKGPKRVRERRIKFELRVIRKMF